MTEQMDQIRTMLRQEVTSFGTIDYLSISHQHNLSLPCLDEVASTGSSAHCATSTTTGSDSNSTAITEVWREKICEWCYQVIDHFDFSREIVAITMNYLDRYLATNIVNKKVFQLAAMTALFLSVKIHEPSKLSMSSMIELSRGCFSVQQMVAMEVSLIRGLRWFLHPPTAHSYVQRFLLLVPISEMITANCLYEVLELSRFLVELSVIDYFFVTQRPSHIALAAIANAMEAIATIPSQSQAQVLQFLQRMHNIEMGASSSIVDCRDRIQLLFALQGSLAAPSCSTAQGTSSTATSGVCHRVAGNSPVCVSFGTTNYYPPLKGEDSVS